MSNQKWDKFRHRQNILLSKKTIGATKNWKADLEARESALASAKTVASDYSDAETAIFEKLSRFGIGKA